MDTLGIGIIGCGSISVQYMRNAARFRNARLVACADLRPEAAAARASEYGIRAASVDGLLTDPEVDLVLNLTVPNAHFDVTLSALTAGKHVFTEKPLSTSLATGRRLTTEATSRALKLGSAPDTFMGAAGRHARALVDGGALGNVVLGTAFMMGRGMEHWHPDPRFYYQSGGGPLFDMGPYYLTMLVNLIGPVARVQALSGCGQTARLITAKGPLSGTSFPVETPTTILTLLEFASGVMVTFGVSWDVFRHSNPPIELHGTQGSLRLPDPDDFGGIVSVSHRGADWSHADMRYRLFGAVNWPAETPNRANYRMLGVADLIGSIADGRMPRASGTLALHVLEVMEAVLSSADSGGATIITERGDRPASMTEKEAESLLTSNAITHLDSRD